VFGFLNAAQVKGHRWIMDTQQLLKLGKMQVAAMFDWHEQRAVDDSEFLSLVEVVLTAYEKAGAGKEVVEELWACAFDVYDNACKEADPDSRTQENRLLMKSCVLGSSAIGA